MATAETTNMTDTEATAAILALHAEGVGMHKIAERTGFTYFRVRETIRDASPRQDAPPPRAEPRPVAIDLIRLDHATQARVGMDPPTVARYRDDYKNGETLPPPDVYGDDEAGYWMGDGFHRVHALIAEGVQVVYCVVHPGGVKEAIEHAARSNKDHGLPRSRADAERAVRLLLNYPEWREASDAALARAARVADKTAKAYRDKHRADMPGLYGLPEADPATDQASEFRAPVGPAVPHYAANGHADPAPFRDEEVEGGDIEAGMSDFDRHLAIADAAAFAEEMDGDRPSPRPQAAPTSDPIAAQVDACPLARQLTGAQLDGFRADARLYYAAREALRPFGEQVKRAIGPGGRVAVKPAPYSFRAQQFIRLPDPSRWLRCIGSGDGCPGRHCPNCHGFGYLVQ